jgi:hypothetical protein
MDIRVFIVSVKTIDKTHSMVFLLFLLLLCLLFINSGHNPGLEGDELFCGHTEFEKSGNGLGEAKANGIVKSTTGDKDFLKKRRTP